VKTAILKTGNNFTQSLRSTDLCHNTTFSLFFLFFHSFSSDCPISLAHRGPDGDLGGNKLLGKVERNLRPGFLSKHGEACDRNAAIDQGAEGKPAQKGASTVNSDAPQGPEALAVRQGARRPQLQDEPDLQF
jgi:hypothetical protein